MDPKIQTQHDLPDLVRSILGTSKPRNVQSAFFYNDTYFAVADDGTGWILVRDDKPNGQDYWKQLRNAGVPALPQEGAF